MWNDWRLLLLLPSFIKLCHGQFPQLTSEETVLSCSRQLLSLEYLLSFVYIKFSYLPSTFRTQNICISVLWMLFIIVSIREHNTGINLIEIETFVKYTLIQLLFIYIFDFNKNSLQIYWWIESLFVILPNSSLKEFQIYIRRCW